MSSLSEAENLTPVQPKLTSKKSRKVKKRRTILSDSEAEKSSCSDEDKCVDVTNNNDSSHHIPRRNLIQKRPSDSDIDEESSSNKYIKNGNQKRHIEVNLSGCSTSGQSRPKRPSLELQRNNVSINSARSGTSLRRKKRRQKKRRRPFKYSAKTARRSYRKKRKTAIRNGRREIRKRIDEENLVEETKEAMKEEKSRLERIKERNALIEQIYPIKLDGEQVQLVLDINMDTREELISVDPELVKKLKLHQAEGIKFMWTSCFESMKAISENSKGGGCVIAHCMGLGKTFEVITLIHTLFRYEKTRVKTIMVICPMPVISNWINEFEKWLGQFTRIKIYDLGKLKEEEEREEHLENWNRKGGVLIIGYEMFRTLVAKKNERTDELLIKSVDLVVCDEGHRLRSDSSIITTEIKRIETKRKILLTGTPLQNNLKEYHCMIEVVKPNVLGLKKEFSNRFVNPIYNGQFENSKLRDIRLMKETAYCLHKILEGFVQRFDSSVLSKYIPPKKEYAIFFKLTYIQTVMYEYYIENCAKILNENINSANALFADCQELRRIWTHPFLLRLHEEKKHEQLRSAFRNSYSRQREEFSDDSEYSLDYVDSDCSSESECQSSGSQQSNSTNNNSEVYMESQESENGRSENSHQSENFEETSNPGYYSEYECSEQSGFSEEESDPEYLGSEVSYESESSTESEYLGSEVSEESESEEKTYTENSGKDSDYCSRKSFECENPNQESNHNITENSVENTVIPGDNWWSQFVGHADFEDMRHSNKLLLLFEILKNCEKIGDKLIVYSHSLYSLQLIENFLELIDKETQKGNKPESLAGYTGTWVLGADYFKLDGNTSPEKRIEWCNIFNSRELARARLLLASSKAGAGLNLTGANRLVIFDASWNASVDEQCVFRIYRFGQTKPCYIYRFITAGTMEEEIYKRQITKLSLSRRVVDEQQIQNHYSKHHFNDFYKCDSLVANGIEGSYYPDPQDNLLIEALFEYIHRILKYNEHESLLRNILSAALTEEEQQMAWNEFQKQLEEDLRKYDQNRSSSDENMETEENLPSTSRHQEAEPIYHAPHLTRRRVKKRRSMKHPLIR